MDLGFEMAGFHTIWANDNYHDAVETFKQHFDCAVIEEDVKKIDISSIPDSDVIVGGFPCQGFSVANTGRTIDDERNELYKFFVKILREKQPKFFVAENVKGILSLGKGEVFKRILQDFSKAGYDCQYAVLNAANYGVPQSRQRVVILGKRADLEVELSFPPKPTHAPQAMLNLKPHVSIGKALNGIPNPDGTHKLKNHVYTKYKVKYNGYISNRKVDPSKPSPTITARGDEKGGAMIINHPHESRRLSCRELALLQAFPLDFEFSGSMTSVYRQIGNAVPSLMAKAVAAVICEALPKIKKRKVFEIREKKQIELQPQLLF